MKTPRQLVGRNVHGIDVARAVLQQAIREPSGGRSDIEARFSFGIDAEILEAALELESPAARIFCGVAADFDLRIDGDLRPRFVAARSVHAHFSGEDHRLRFFTRFGEPALDDEKIEPPFVGFRFGGQGD